jgi:hypothetical protein
MEEAATEEAVMEEAAEALEAAVVAVVVRINAITLSAIFVHQIVRKDQIFLKI